MSKTWAVCRRELNAYFASPLAYVVAAVFLLLASYFFVLGMRGTREASLRIAFGFMSTVFIFAVPLLTMRTLAEEMRQGTDELLLTAPLRVWQIVVGKYLATVFLLAVMLGLTAHFPLTLLRFGNPDAWPMATGYLGLLLLGAAFAAAGVFASSLSSNQIVAALVGFALTVGFLIVDAASEWVGPRAAAVLNNLSIVAHYDDFEKGILDSTHFLYFAAFIAVFLFLAVRRVEARHD